MKILALETSTELASIALSLDGQIIQTRLSSPPAHSATLLPEIRQLLAGQGLALTALDGIACGIGPGAFTGVRLACSVAQGLALGADLVVHPVCSLLALAEAMNAREVYCAMDARMGEVYVAAYRREATGWVEVITPCCVAPNAAPLVPEGGWLGAGNAFAAYPALGEHLQSRVRVPDAACVPDAAAIARLAGQIPGVDPALVAPLYVRDRVAQTVAERLANGGRA
ncbi:tRNA (adenosine(37)-N6)-threonylcarbamoyltransferase complex dimerization subunit type 1 TsaB [Uliginosibacterium sp. 31-12]|uniref:tRNA (adenosine(37)-N6)-threonylcarbamoyltransferase complex dimerization subunit type 1 TsaB n=1 Tax=Uliginosibacterium sp. 31-12 TaxID=3062781 RepID=UPI0026E323D8|nr:tRNA (adenosine(37)-N6)-threonylcarbamoyltransferase complex dimerization subunit type 1 TsaB [Uliginosibacterium sp. 31-12]MDO6385482.1 tRNA (adenosine(37)-N6)-threonylcarbamoyltransferase complex dimerization subunit type 1 TsaB [Uliginosibacterium sp. 31-12]